MILQCYLIQVNKISSIETGEKYGKLYLVCKKSIVETGGKCGKLSGVMYDMIYLLSLSFRRTLYKLHV